VDTVGTHVFVCGKVKMFSTKKKPKYPLNVPAITFSDDGPCAQLNAASMFRIRRRWPKSNRCCPDDSGENRGGGGGGGSGTNERCDGRSANKSARACRGRTRRENRTANKIFVITILLFIIVVARFSVPSDLPSPERIVEQDRQQRQPRGQCA